jgi:hypothetical protein
MNKHCSLCVHNFVEDANKKDLCRRPFFDLFDAAFRKKFFKHESMSVNSCAPAGLILFAFTVAVCGRSLLPILGQQEISYVSVFDAVAAHVQLVHRNDVFGIVVADAVIRSEFPFDSFFGGQQVADLDIELAALLFTDEINFFCRGFADRHAVAPAQQFHEDDVFQHQIDVFHVAAENCFADAVVGYVIFFIHGEDLLAPKVLPVNTVK